MNTADVAWMLMASSMVLFMTPGLAFFYGGMVSAKNVISTMLQCFIALGVVSVLWIVVGFSLAFGDSLGGVVGNPITFFMFQGVSEATDARLSPTIPLLLFALFQLKFAIITPALISGAFAERVRFSAYLLFVTLFTLVIYAPLAHWTWHPDGFLRQWGVLDFAGGTVVHMSAGLAALAGALRARAAAEPPRRGSARAGAHSVHHSRHRHALVRMVRLQCRIGAGGQRHRRARLRDNQHRVGGGDDGVDRVRVDARLEAVGDWRVHRRGGRPRRDHARRPAFVSVPASIAIGVLAAERATSRCTGSRSRRSTTRWTSSRATASAAWPAWCSPRCLPTTAA